MPDTAAQIAVEGMDRGTFTGVSLFNFTKLFLQCSISDKPRQSQKWAGNGKNGDWFRWLPRGMQACNLKENMRFLRVFICFIFLSGAILRGSPLQIGAPISLHESDKISKAPSSDLFANVRSLTRKKTEVPLRLPGILPAAGAGEPRLYAILESANDHGYEIQLAFTEDCNGGNYCHYGTVRGSTSPIIEENRKRVPLILRGGIKGYFIGFTCGAHCDDSSIGWSENGYHYSIDLKAGRMKEMIRMANSAIIAGHKAEE
jgi:hypothetical protein